MLVNPTTRWWRTMIANLVVALIIPVQSANLSINMPETAQTAAGWSLSQLSSVRALVTNHVQEVRDSMAQAAAVESTRERDQAFIDTIQHHQQEQRNQQLALEHALGASEELLRPTADQPHPLVEEVRRAGSVVNHEAQQTANQAAGNGAARQLVNSPRIDLEVVAGQSREAAERQRLNDDSLLERINARRAAAALHPIPRARWPELTQTGVECSLLAEDLCVECRLRHSHRVECSRFDRKEIQPPHVLPSIGEGGHPAQLQPTEQPALSPLPVDINGNYRTIRLPASRCQRLGTEAQVLALVETRLVLVGVYVGQVLGGDGHLYYDVVYRADYQQPDEVLTLAREHWDHGSGLGSIDLLSDHRRDAALRRQARMLGDVPHPPASIPLYSPPIGTPVGYSSDNIPVASVRDEPLPTNVINMSFTVTPQGAHARSPDEPA